jgi:V8-like Glu-specific endopeptidase
VTSRWTETLRREARPKRASAKLTDPINRASSSFHSQPVGNVAKFPYSAVGCLFFLQNGKPFSATACVVAKNIVFTAAHNLWDGGVVSTDIVFQPQYKDGSGLGSWTADPQHIVIPEEWKTEGTATFDFAAFRTTTELPIDKTGMLVPNTAGVAAGTSCRAIGYPDGKEMWESIGPLDYALSFLAQMESDLAAGSGGGPWLTELAGVPAFIGCTAQNYPEFDLIVGPPFGSSVHQVISAAGG